MSARTAQFAESSSELIALLEHSLPTLFNECIKLDSERAHALAQIFKVEIHAW